MPDQTSLRFRVGYRAAQVGAALHVVGGLADQAVTSLLPRHVELLGAEAAAAPGVSRMVLTLLHSLGSSLIATGVALLVLLHLWRRERTPWVALAIAAVAVLAEGVNGIQMLRLGIWLGAGPLAFAGLVAAGVALATNAPPGGAGGPGVGRQD